MMKDPGLFAMFGATLGLVAPWQVTSVEFDQDVGKLQIRLDFPRGSRFACPHEGCRNASCPVHDTMEKTWRHPDFFEHQAYLTARVPRVELLRARCPPRGGPLGPPGQRLQTSS
jgi:transposase